MTPGSALLLALLLKASGIPAAEPAPQPNPCGPFQDIAAQLAGKYREVPTSLGVNSAGGLLILFEAPGGRTWTLVVQPPDAKHGACIVSAGRNWGEAPSLPTGKET